MPFRVLILCKLAYNQKKAKPLFYRNCEIDDRKDTYSRTTILHCGKTRQCILLCNYFGVQKCIKWY